MSWKRRAVWVAPTVGPWALLGLLFVLGCRGKPNAGASNGASNAPADPARVDMSPEALRAAGVTTVRVSRAEVVVGKDLSGTIEAPRDALAIVNTRAAGVVDSLAFDVGDRVRAGQRMAIVRSVELAETQAAYRSAVVAHRFATTALARTEALRTEGVVSERRVETDRLKAQEKQLALQEAIERVRILGGSPASTGGLITVTAPIAGVVTERNANRGEAVEANGPLFTVVDTRHVIVQLRAPGGTPVVPGTEVQFTAESLPDHTFTAVVRSATDVLDPNTRRFLIRCAVDNADAVLKPGMFVTGRLPHRTVRAVTVPEAAIQDLPDGPAVFVALGNGRFERRTVVAGARAHGEVAIERGLREGETVVAQGSFWVRTQLQRAEIEE